MQLIQDIFTKYGSVYLEKYGKKMPSLHKKALHAIMNCRTKSLGGEVYYCKKCNEYHYSYHSCGNRHCAVCQNNDAADLIERNKKMMLPFTYFLGTFTMPEELRKLCRKEQRLFYSILFKSSSYALKLLAKDEKYLGAEIGMIGILHTWSRALVYHPHVHCLIPGGGISEDGKTIRFSDEDFLIHVKPLSTIFRAKFRDNLKEHAPEIFNKIPAKVWKRDWVVHMKPVGNGEKAMEYMGRYLFRVAIINNRIIKFEDGKVTFRYTDGKTGKTKIVTLDALEFIRRFLQHVLLHNFMKVRYYGYLASAAKKK
ncbi:MAG: transposase, partial [Calditrichia bacterium]